MECHGVDISRTRLLFRLLAVHPADAGNLALYGSIFSVLREVIFDEPGLFLQRGFRPGERPFRRTWTGGI